MRAPISMEHAMQIMENYSDLAIELTKERDTLKRALELACGIINVDVINCPTVKIRDACHNAGDAACAQCWAAYFINQAQEEELCQ